MQNPVTVSTTDGLDSRGLFTTVEESPEALERHVAAWDVLARHAAEPNPFYESYALLAAWRHLRPEGLRVVCVWSPNVLPGKSPHLAGVFPIVCAVQSHLPMMSGQLVVLSAATVAAARAPTPAR